MTIGVNEFIEKIKLVDLSKLSYNKLKALIRFNVIQFPYTTALVKKGAFIERGRINGEDGIFYNSEFDISYRIDVGNMKEFGRANEPFTSRFYGAMISEEIPFARVVLFAELVEEFVNIPTSDFEITITTGRWFVKEDFEVADVCYSKNYFEIADIKKRYEFWISKLKETEHEVGQEEYQNLLSFFSDEFAKTEIKNHHDYKLSCLYADFAIYANKLSGVCYPSVKAGYKANNIVLTKEAVEQFLELREVAMFKYQIKNGKPSVIPTFYSDNLGPFNTNFNWKKVE